MRYYAVDRWPGRDVAFEMEITEYERPTRLAAQWFDPMAGSWRAAFADDGDDTTRMDFTATIEPDGVMRFVEPLLRPWARKQLAAGLASFKEWVESSLEAASFRDGGRVRRRGEEVAVAWSDSQFGWAFGGFSCCREGGGRLRTRTVRWR